MRSKFIYQDGNSNKFWDIEINRNQFTVYFGKAGTQGQTQTKEYTSEEECRKAADKLIAEKVKKGYSQVAEDASDEPVSTLAGISETASDALPKHLFVDLLALARHLADGNYPGELETVDVTDENIEEMEAVAGFQMPEEYVDFWLEKGSLFFSKDDFICTVYCYNAEGVNGNNLHGLLNFYQHFYRCKFKLIDEEAGYLSKCWWVLGMIINGEAMRIFVSDPLGTIKSIHFPQALRNTSDEAFAQALSPVLEAKASMKSIIGAAAFEALARNTSEAEPETETEEDENKETQAFLEKHGLKAVSYGEVLEALNVEHLSDYWDDEDNSYASNYESEREYFEEYSSAIYYCDGDLHIEGDLAIPQAHIDLLVVRGNMTIRGKISSSYAYYVTGNTTVDYLELGYFQKTIGTETIRYVASAWGEDDEVVHSMPFRSINAPYFFSWFYDLGCFEFAPETLITALYNYDELSSYVTDNAFLAWHDYAYAFVPEFCYTLEESHHDTLNISIRSVYEALKNNQPVLQKGVTPEGIKLTREGLRLKNQEDITGAYQCFKEAITKSPAYYLAYYHAGKCLFEQKAYKQAMEIFAKGIPYTPEKVKYELACMEESALSAVQIGEYDKAIELANKALQKSQSAYFALRVIGEALIYKQQLEEAKSYLERSVDARSIFTNNWLLGLVYHLQGEDKKADKFYKEAAEKSIRAQPYTQHTSLHYVYGDPVTVNWDTQPATSTVKDQAYWDQFFTDMLGKYGPDMYKKTSKFPDEWLSAKLITIPEQYRTRDMLQALLEHKTKGDYDVRGRVIVLFKRELYTPDIILLAVNREEPCFYNEIPAEFLSEEIYQIHPHGIDLAYVPKEQLTYDLCFRAVIGSQYNYNHVPAAFRDERMNIALIAGGNLRDTHCKDLPSKYYTNKYIKQAIDLGVQVIKNIPPRLVDTEIYQYAAGKYSQDPEWPFIVELYDRDRWRFGSQSDLEQMGKAVKKYGMSIFDHIDVERINKQSYAYYGKHLGQLPGFPQKAAAAGWDERSKVKDEYFKQTEFDYDTFDKVWACYWDEDFIIKAITANGSGSSERIYDVPQKYLTQRICDIAVKKDSYDFQFVPKHFMTQEMCEKACSMDYGTALEYVPLSMRTAKVCELAIGRDITNIKFVPLELRTVAFCAGAVLSDRKLSKYIPHAQYSAVFEMLLAKYKNRFSLDYLLVNRGLGLIIDKKYDEARKQLTAIETTKNVDASHLHQSVYYLGWTYFLEGDASKATEYYRKSQDIAKAQKIEDEDWLTYPYANFQLPDVPGVYEFSQEEFGRQMQEASLLVQDKNYVQAIDILSQAEKLLRDAQCSEMRLWAFVWDHQRYALYEAGWKEESLAVCRNTIAELSKITLWDYLEEFNPIRAALRSAHNNLAYHCYETATDLKGVEEGLKHIKTTMKTVAPIEEKDVLNLFYETQALLLHKAMSFDPGYKKDLEKVVAKIEKLKLRENGLLSDEYIEKVKL
ncbi:WGR domain-containing protein [Chitinophaga filiformis]|uniref:WGR domain-containing protein, predicted DNA-binding domain in MolR n=1 Tax=Chitinophaga filiformis TaxID=104663 RepID=A0A1G7LIR8_CHIFI|nr:WGR domain-containing protein [Chitinophaga filiformis]SDF49417.1 WGR domain-containing protein, predicted DNA-binding domain in MolR [Chitinophaga filiformis]